MRRRRSPCSARDGAAHSFCVAKRSSQELAMYLLARSSSLSPFPPFSDTFFPPTPALIKGMIYKSDKGGQGRQKEEGLFLSICFHWSRMLEKHFQLCALRSSKNKQQSAVHARHSILCIQRSFFFAQLSLSSFRGCAAKAPHLAEHIICSATLCVQDLRQGARGDHPTRLSVCVSKLLLKQSLRSRICLSVCLPISAQ